jgi:hypothetical protein
VGFVVHKMALDVVTDFYGFPQSLHANVGILS